MGFDEELHKEYSLDSGIKMEEMVKSGEYFKRQVIKTVAPNLNITNLYPTPDTHVRLGGMIDLMREFEGVPVGLSDHTIDNTACNAALALGAQLVERHFTDHKQRIGPDICCSMDEIELVDLLDTARRIPLMLGGNKEAHIDEKVTSDFAFQSVIALRDIEPGEMFTSKNIGLKRPGTGAFNADDFFKLVDKISTQFIPADE